MNCLKKIIVLLLVCCTAFCCVGCGDRLVRGDTNYDLDIAGVYIEDYTGGRRYRYLIDDAKEAKQIFDAYLDLKIKDDPSAKAGASYITFRFYNEDVSEEALFTIYENGSCCIGRDYDTFYTVEKGRTAYMDLAELYENCPSVIAAEDYKETSSKK